MHYHVKFHVLADAIGFIPEFFLKNCEIFKKPVFLYAKGVKNSYISKTTRNFEKLIAPIVLESQNLYYSILISAIFGEEKNFMPFYCLKHVFLCGLVLKTVIS